MCRMSSRDKMNVQDQSKERGVELSEETEGGPGKPSTPSTLSLLHVMMSKCILSLCLSESGAGSSPDADSGTTPTVGSADKVHCTQYNLPLHPVISASQASRGSEGCHVSLYA